MFREKSEICSSTPYIIVKSMNKTLLLKALALLLLFSSTDKINLTSTVKAYTIVVPDNYPTIQEAITHAVDGDTVFVKSGTYLVDENTTIVVNKTLSLIGEDPAATVILGATNESYENGIAIRLAAPNSTVSGFTITNFVVAIAVANYYDEPYPSGCKIINNNIVNNSEGIRPQRNNLLISENNITKNNVGISGYNTQNIIITRNRIIGNGYGVNIGACRNVTVTENQIANNTYGLNLVYYGPYLISGNSITGNSCGIRFAEACNNATVYGNSITQNTVGAALLIFPNAGDLVVSGVGNIVFGNLFIDNTKQVAQEKSPYNYPSTTRMGTDIVVWDNGTLGNNWDDYSGIDADNDGIGDTPYIIDGDNKDYYPLITQNINRPPTTSTPPSTASPSLSTEPTPEQATVTALIAVAIAAITFAVSGLVYFKKRQKGKKL
ncbi:MAG: right-handed parallel beta-helix repeat-containing protein [Candidatus Bathyarchaeota archaeon]|nr:right-handed parallel beta-helix repeat-containing protein [Candidatus Bathyarchaeota archaeon]